MAYYSFKLDANFIVQLILYLAIVLFSPKLAYSDEKILSCKMNYGISGENDETDIEFRNLSNIDQTQTLYLDIENNWLSIQSFDEYKNNENKLSKIDFNLTDSIIFSLSYLENNKILVSKNVIELNRYSGFVKHEFRTNTETIYRTGYCELLKKKMF
tara:strand:- start:14 stop:484 length:471 start_codon:yes stop_codon:yes gene_type:complete